MTGKIASIRDRGFGFITPDEGDKDIFFHANSLNGIDFNDLREGDAVTFDVEDGEKGPAAVNVSRGDGAASAGASDDASTSDDATEEAS